MISANNFTKESDDLLNLTLQQYVEEAQRFPHRSTQRQLALTHLTQGILKSNRLGRPRIAIWSASLYEDLYNDALNKTLLGICQNIERYNSQYPVMAWVNNNLKFTLMNVFNDYKKGGLTYVPKSIKVEISSPNNIEYCICVKEALTDDDQLFRQFLEEDPEGFLEEDKLREHPDVTFKILALARLDNNTWLNLEKNLGVSAQTLSSFFHRCLKKRMSYLQKNLCNKQ
jgi:hypothetical protein